MASNNTKPTNSANFMLKALETAAWVGSIFFPPLALVAKGSVIASGAKSLIDAVKTSAPDEIPTPNSPSLAYAHSTLVNNFAGKKPLPPIDTEERSPLPSEQVVNTATMSI